VLNTGNKKAKNKHTRGYHLAEIGTTSVRREILGGEVFWSHGERREKKRRNEFTLMHWTQRFKGAAGGLLKGLRK